MTLNDVLAVLKTTPLNSCPSKVSMFWYLSRISGVRTMFFSTIGTVGKIWWTSHPALKGFLQSLAIFEVNGGGDFAQV